MPQFVEVAVQAVEEDVNVTKNEPQAPRRAAALLEVPPLVPGRDARRAEPGEPEEVVQVARAVEQTVETSKPQDVEADVQGKQIVVEAAQVPPDRQAAPALPAVAQIVPGRDAHRAEQEQRDDATAEVAPDTVQVAPVVRYHTKAEAKLDVDAVTEVLPEAREAPVQVHRAQVEVSLLMSSPSISSDLRGNSLGTLQTSQTALSTTCKETGVCSKQEFKGFSRTAELPECFICWSNEHVWSACPYAKGLSAEQLESNLETYFDNFPDRGNFP